MKLKMTIDEALKFADEWSRGMTIHEDSRDWRVVCMVLAADVRMLREVVEAAAAIDDFGSDAGCRLRLAEMARRALLRGER